MNTPDENSLEDTVVWLRAAGESTRLRLLALLDKMDLTVSDLIFILNQSQPRISRHLRLLVEAGLAERFQEGAWAYFRTIDHGPARAFLNGVLKALDNDNGVLENDQVKLQAISEKRIEKAKAYFAQNAEQWGQIRSLHVAESDVEKAMLEIALPAQPQSLLDLGTGTGRVLQLFAPHIERAIGLDTSHDMLSVARSSMAYGAFGHLQVRYGDVYRLGEGQRFDLIVFHQVMHFLEDPTLALRNAKRRLAKEGQVLIVDFAPHDCEFLRDEHAHRRLGIASEQMKRWFALAGLRLRCEQMLQAEQGEGGDSENLLTVVLWLAEHSDTEGFE